MKISHICQIKLIHVDKLATSEAGTDKIKGPRKKSKDRREPKFHIHKLSRLMGKPTICIGENKDADQLRGNRQAHDQRLYFRYSDSKIRPVLKSEISSFYLFSVLVQVGLCRTCLETTLLVFPRVGSFFFVLCKLVLKAQEKLQYKLL